MSDLRVPPSVTFNFERVVADVCHRAKLDTGDWPLRARELLDHLQERWREGVENGLSTDAAQTRAVELFGSPVVVARRLRQPWIKRLLYHQNCRLHRYLTFLAASLCGTLLIGFEHLLLKDSAPDAAQIVGSFTNAFIALGALFLIQWKPRGPTWLRTVLLIRHVLWFFVGTGLLNSAVTPLLALAPFFRSDHLLFGLSVLALPIGFGFLGSACLVSEIAGSAGRRKSKTDELLAFKIIR